MKQQAVNSNQALNFSGTVCRGIGGTVCAEYPLTSEAIEILKLRKQNVDQFVFVGEGTTGHIVEPKSGWDRILTRANIKDLRIHDLRRTLGSWQAKTGASLIIVGKSLGHKSQQATAIYSRLDLDPVRKSIELATNAMLEAAKRK